MSRPALFKPASILLQPVRPRSLTTQLSSQQCATKPALVRVVAAGISRKRWYATEKDDKGGKESDFTGQLWQSTKNRVSREKAEQFRYAVLRDDSKDHEPEPLRTRIFVSSIVLLSVMGLSYWFGTLRNPPQATTSTLKLKDTKAPKHDISKGNMQAAWVDFRNIVGGDNISMTEDDVSSHSGSEWSTYSPKEGERPFCVVRPGSTDEVSSLVKICHKRGIPITGYAGGTSLEGHFASTRGGVVMDFSRMDKIIALHEDDMDVVVQPAVGWEDLNEELAEHGLFFPPDPGPGAKIGGMVGTGCSGTNAYRYGTMRDWVLSLTVVLADGTVVKTRQRPRKSSAGYDLTRTFIGSEGTLGLVTEATLKVTSKPDNERVAVCSFPSVRDAAECVFKVVRAGIPIAAVELLDDVQMKCINDAGVTSKSWTEAPTLFFKFSGPSANSVKESISLVQKQAKATNSKTFEFARDEDEAAELWSARKEALWSVMAKKDRPDTHVWTTDVAVPLSMLPTIIDETKRDIQQSGLTASIVGHVGDGNFHAIMLYNDDQRQRADDVVHRMVKRAIQLEGTATGEHGVGLVKRDYLEHELGKTTVDTMRMLKKAWDPQCLLNCDKIVRSEQPAKGEVMEW